MRLDRKVSAISLLVLIGVRADGQKVLLAIKSMGNESTEARRAVLDDLLRRGLRRPEFLSSRATRACACDGCRRGWHAGTALHRPQALHLLAHAPERLQGEITAHDNDMIYAARREEIEARR